MRRVAVDSETRSQLHLHHIPSPSLWQRPCPAFFVDKPDRKPAPGARFAGAKKKGQSPAKGPRPLRNSRTNRPLLGLVAIPLLQGFLKLLQTPGQLVNLLLLPGQQFLGFRGAGFGQSALLHGLLLCLFGHRTS